MGSISLRDVGFKHFQLFASCDQQVLKDFNIFHIPILLILIFNLTMNFGLKLPILNFADGFHELPVEEQRLV